MSSWNKLQESEEQLVAHFVGGLKDKLKEKIALQPQYSLTNAINVVERLEHQSSHYSNYSYRASSSKDVPKADKGILSTQRARSL